MIASSIPNFLTVFRFFLVYPIVISILEENYQLTLFFFFLAGISDFLDGYLARKYSWESRFGKIFDPISDKVLVIATLISLSLVGEINIYLTMFLLSRDLFIIVGVILSSLLIDNYEIKPYFSGKFNSFVLMTYLGFVIIEVTFGLVPEVFLNFLMVALVITSLYSVIEYLNYPGSKERSLDQLKNFSFLKKMISEIELFFSNEENFLLLNIKEDLIRNYLFHASSNSCKTQPKIIDLNEKIFNPDVFKYPMVFIKNLSSDTLNQESEIFLFNGFNYCLNQNTKILFSSNDFIKNLDIKLADLESRLNTVLPVENLITVELQQRGLEINDKEMQYIFTHHSRDLNSLLNLAEKLDEISHQEKKSISINLIALSFLV